MALDVDPSLHVIKERFRACSLGRSLVVRTQCFSLSRGFPDQKLRSTKQGFVALALGAHYGAGETARMVVRSGRLFRCHRHDSGWDFGSRDVACLDVVVEGRKT